MFDMRTFYRKSNLTDIWHFCRELRELAATLL